MSLALPGQGVRERDPDRAVLAADQQINMGELGAIASQSLANEQRHGFIS